MLQAESLDELMSGFDDTPRSSASKASDNVSIAKGTDIMDGFDDQESEHLTQEESWKSEDTEGSDMVRGLNHIAFMDGFSGKLTQQLALSYNDKDPENIFSSLRNTLFLDYEKKFDNGVHMKVNARAFYDGIYDIRKKDYTEQERDSLRTEIRLFDAYLEWRINDALDVKAGRQIIVWGRSDTIRITDILNPVDIRRPGFDDIEELRLPVGMIRFDYTVGEWRITPILIVEQQFNLLPPYGSPYNPLPEEKHYPYPPEDENYNDITYAISASADFHGWDIAFYAAHVYDDIGYFKNSDQETLFYTPTKLYHAKSNMLGSACNILNGSWLFRTEVAYWSKLHYTTIPDDTMRRIDGLVGIEYSGFSDVSIDYDVAVRHFFNFDERLIAEGQEKDTYQHALRIRAGFLHDELHLNYLHTRFGIDLKNGGYQRIWLEYQIEDALHAEAGIIDYFGGSQIFDTVKDESTFYVDISYSF